MRQRSPAFIGRGCAKKPQRKRPRLVSDEDAATLSQWGFVSDDYKKLMRLAYAHHRCTRQPLDFAGSCAIARDILDGEMALIVRTAERVESMPYGLLHHNRMLKEVASRIAAVA